MADCGPSATSLVISRPRIIGPGCITSARGAFCASRAACQLVAGDIVGQIQFQARQPLLLNAQHHHHLRAAHRVLEVALDDDARPYGGGSTPAAAPPVRTG